jgi:hypothetical protein
MSAERSQRPGGVTVLAIINILGFVIGLLSLLGAIYQFVTAGVGVEESYPTASGFYLVEGLNGALCLLLLTSGVGLLGCRKFLGRHLSSILFLASLARSIAVVQVAPEQFGLFSVALVVWPLLAAILVNTVFTDDLIR